MKLSHIAKSVNTDKGPIEVLTHFLHTRSEVININNIVAIWFIKEQAQITTVDGMVHTVSDTKEVELLKNFFQWEK